jgi:hypothetical protein
VEEVLVVLIQFIAEVLFEVLIYIPFDLPLRRDAKTGERSGPGWLALYVLAGGAVGGLSLLVAPHLVIHTVPLRLANLVVAPVVAGALSWWLADVRRSQGAATEPMTHLWTAFWFVLAYSSVRLAYAAR